MYGLLNLAALIAFAVLAIASEDIRDRGTEMSGSNVVGRVATFPAPAYGEP